MEKEISSLKFSDFTGSEFKYDHTKDNPWESVGASSKEVEELRIKMTDVFKNNETVSESVEKILKMDVPAPWKALGLMKIGESVGVGKLMEIIRQAPDSLPLPVLKGIIMIKMMGGNL